MAYTWGFRPGEIQTSKDSATVPYRLIGEPDPITARSIATANAPLIFGFYRRKDVQLSDRGMGNWDVDAEYGLNDQKEPEAYDYKWGFDTTGVSKHITQAIEHIGTYPAPGKTAIDHKGSIGVTDDSVEGTDVPDRAFKWHETWWLPLPGFGFVYSAILGQLNGRMNSGYFRGFAAGTVRFEGAVGGASPKDSNLAEHTFNFTFSPSESGLSVGPITGIAKGGWDYLWVRYENDEDAAAKKTTLQPRQAEVDRVLYPLDFSVFGIGTQMLT